MEVPATSCALFTATLVTPRRFVQPSTLPNIRKFRSVTSTICVKCQSVGIKSDGDGVSKKMFFLGMGYVARYFAQDLKTQGWDVSGTCTSSTKKMELEQKGFHAHIFDACEPEWKILNIMNSYNHLLVSVPTAENVGDPVLQFEDYLKSRLSGGNLQWLGYLSSTSVYGDAEGAWVDENYPPKPLSNLAKLRLRAEEGWLKLGQDLGITTYVFRLGGIYGPGRSAIDTLLKKEPLSERQKRRASNTFTSRVHVADICQALGASISMRVNRQIYNVVDDDPASRAEVFEFAQHLIEKRWPGLVRTNEILSLENTHPVRGEKRVSNALMKKELGVRLIHPSYKSGLQSIVKHMIDPASH